MEHTTAMRIATRFAGLPADKRGEFLTKMQEQGVSFGQLPIPAAAEPQATFELSYAQQRQWFLWQLDPQSSAYNIPAVLRLHGRLNVAALQQSFDVLLERHQSLRSRFVEDDGQVLQTLAAFTSLSIEQHDLRDEPVAQRFEAAMKKVEQQIARLFDLQHGPLLRVSLLQLDAEDHVLVLTLHHIVTDGWSMGVLVEEFSRLYAAHCQGQNAALEALPIQYSDYAAWQRRWMEAGELERQLNWWREQLGSEQPLLELPTDRPRPAQPSQRGARLDFALDADLSSGLMALAKQRGVTPFMLLLASFQALLYRYSGQADLRIGVPIGNRNRAESRGLIGFFVNTQVMRAKLDGRLPFSQLLEQTRVTSLGAQDYQDLPFERLVQALQGERSLSHSPLFQVMFNHQQARPAAVSGLLAGLRVEALNATAQTTQFDLQLDTQEEGDKLFASLTYATDLFDAERIEHLARHWRNLLAGVLANPQTPLAELPLLDADERLRMLDDLNDTAQVYPGEVCAQRHFEARVRENPQATALVFQGESLSYAQLNLRANRLAHHLRAQGVGPDVIVGIACDRSFEMVVGLLAILKAGGAYVPLDPEYPLDRLSDMIEDSGIALLLTQAHLLAQLPTPDSVRTLCLHADADWLSDLPGSDLPNLAVAENLAYMIYTSGSTGKPKGAGNRHVALHNRIEWMQQAYNLLPSDRVLQKTPFSFDVSVWEFFWPLMKGATLVIPAPGEHRDPQRLAALIVEQSVTTLHFVPSMLSAFIGADEAQACTSLTRIICSGEALPMELQRQTLRSLPQAQLYNLYGPTEAAIDVTHWTCVEEGRDSVPIGRPIANLRTCILDDELQVLPLGAVGELYLGGIGLARGYHRRSALTAERFVADPFGSGERLYRTGDLARYRADGAIDYCGRIDHQVKIRGLRIELGEIEVRLQEHADVQDAVVLALDGPSGKQLVAYIVPQDRALVGADADRQGAWRETLKSHLLGSLPDYMVPAQTLLIEHMPLSPNGKLDRKRLPAPTAQVSQRAFEAPRSAHEQVLAQIWQDVLGIEQVGRQDNFFELGGDSIISIQVVSRARRAGLSLQPRDLFQQQTLQALAAVVKEQAAPLAQQGPVDGVQTLTPIQRWFFEEPIPQRAHWNQALLLTPRETLELPRLQGALQRVLKQHDALRLRFSQVEGQWSARYVGADSADVIDMLWTARVACDASLEAVCEEAQRSLSLQDGPLLRVALIARADGSQRLLLVIHHLAVDGVSWRVLLEDLQAAYQGEELPPKSSAFQAWADKLDAYARSETAASELNGWQAQLAGASDTLPVANPQASQAGHLRQSVSIGLDREQTRQLLQQAPAIYRTQVNDLLLTALARTLSRWTGHPSALIQLEGHGREELFDDIDLTRTVGWFSSLFPVHLTPTAELGASIKAIKQQLRDIPGKGLGYGLLRYMGDAAAQTALAALPQARVTFNYLGQFDQSFAEDALFTPAKESSGAAQSTDAPLPNWLSVDGQVYGGELKLDWTFSRECFELREIEALAIDFRAELLALIDHCLSDGAGGVTPVDFPLARLSQAQLDGLPVPPAQIEDVYPLSPMQAGLLFHSLYESASGAYVNQLSVEARGLDAEHLGRAWQAVLDSHAILRSSFHFPQGFEAPVQLVHRHLQLPLTCLDWRGCDDQAHALAQLIDSERLQLDSTQAPLMRLTLVRLDDERQQLIYTHHHLLLDGWSNSLLLSEVLQRYAGQEVKAPSGRFADYIGWLQRQDADADEAFWRGQLATLDNPTLLAQSLAHVGVKHPSQAQFADHRQTFDVATSKRFSDFARQQKVTLNTLVQGAWVLLLQRYSGQRSVAFGATVAGRPVDLPGAENQLGLFINTLPVISRPDAVESVEQWLSRLQAQNLELREHEFTALGDIQRWAGRAGEPLFDSLLVFENFPVAEALQQSAPAGLSFSIPQNHERTNFPLTLAATAENQLSLNWSYQCSHFSSTAIARMSEHLTALLMAMVAAPQAALSELDLLTAPERAQQLLEWNPPFTVAQNPLCVHQLIEAQAVARPDATALIFNDVALSFDELNRRANRLAHHLRGRGIGPEVRVGLTMQRSPDMIVGLLAILKAGGAYVPLDPAYPAERLSYLMDDSGISLLISQSWLREKLPLPQGLAVLEIDREPLERMADSNPVNLTCGENLAYLIYTSGSTGRPKGVSVAHGPLAMHCVSIGELYGMTPDDRELQFASISFDGAHERWLTPLVFGSAVMPRDDELWSVERTCAEIEKHGITIACFTPSYLAQIADYMGEAGRDLPIRSYTPCGEGMAKHAFDEVQQVLQPKRLINGYGPTETVITPLIWLAYPDTEFDSAFMPIGRPVGNRSAYILDGGLQPLPVGVAGELYLGGEGVARGYHQRPDLTAERFVPDPFVPGARLYRSGDLARFRADGVVEYLGRIDQQVKIRGFRIELGEIEACLMEHAGVREAFVIDRDGPTSRQLVGYVVPRDPLADEQDLRDALTAHLRSRLPAHMLPAHLMCLAALPLTPNGKLDRQGLPAPEASRQSHDQVAAATPAEALLVEIWQELLGLDSVGVTENFFELGGDSIISLQAVSRAGQRGLLFSPKQLFEQQTIRALATVASHRENTRVQAPGVEAFALVPHIDLTAREGLQDLYPLSPMQQGMLFHCLDSPELNPYVNQLSVAVDGLQVPRFRAAWQALVERHEVLRAAFRWRDGLADPLQAVFAEVELPIEELDWRERSDTEQALSELAAAEQAKGFDLSCPPLMRFVLVRLGEDRYQMIWIYHHLLLDGWSASRLLGEMLRLYHHDSLPALTGRYADYIGWLQRQDDAQAEGFWRERLALLEAPTILAKASGAAGSGHGVLYSDLNAEATRKLHSFAKRQRVTLNTLVQGAWLLLLQRHSGQRSVAFGATVAGRPTGLAGAQEMLGLFINTLPVIQTLDPQQPLGEWLRELQDYNLAVRDYEHTPLSDVQRWAGQGGQGLFDSIIVFENHPVDRALRGGEEGELRFADVGSGGVTHFPMDLMVSANDEGLEVEYLYLRDRFSDVEVERIRAQLEGLLRALPEDADRLLGNIGLPEARLSLPQASTDNADLLLAFNRHVRNQPQKTALFCEDREVSYADLDARANGLAQKLIARGIGAESLVAVALPRSERTIVAFLAVLKAGAAYLPLDLAYPAERLAYMLSDSAASLLLCDSDLGERLTLADSPPRLLLDQLTVVGSSECPVVEPLPGHLAYLIYTSGSTGQPKGVAVSRGPIARHCRGIIDLYELAPRSRELHFMSFAFDGAQERWLSVMLAGGSLVIREDSLWTPEQTLEVLHRHNVTVACFPPAYLQQMAEVAERLGNPPAVEVYCFGGDAVPDASFEQVKRALRPQRLVNGYGPTETVVTPLLWRAEASETCAAAYAPIGRGVAGRGLYVLDADLNPLPVGVSGELYLGGECLARGYHQRPGMSAERFIPDPFEAGGRMYRTGDLVRQRECGLIDYLGRLDQQVKIRGFRIEPGEIEARLRECAGVQDAAVVVLDTPTGKQLVGYVVAGAAAGLDRCLKVELQAQMPDYMVPARILVLERFPLSANGKLDRRALPSPEWTLGGFRAPRNALEQALTAIWQDVLGVPQVGIDDNFFELGGDSLQVLKVISRVRSQPQPGFELKLRDLMQKPCIAELSGYQAAEPGKAPDPLLALNGRVANVPALFCLHAGFGTVFDYEPLARRLEGRRTVYGLQCRMLLDPQWQDASLLAMAQAYTQRIRAQQPQGPYYLLGWSLGGALTQLVAHELEAQGQAVAFAGLVDSYVAGTAEAGDWREDLADFLKFVLGQPSEEAETLIASKTVGLSECEGAAAVIEAAMHGSNDHAALGASELTQIFATGASLKQLALAQRQLPKVQVAAHRWWVAERDDERRVFEAQVGQHGIDRLVTGGHYELLRSDELLDELEELLERRMVTA
ncbi:non-ribosomal peptide synthase domain TIGR01720/amino acid adenylation domain-containing protein [Pseudomonas reinekei]|uniref:Amino acid adenylation domain-containing protein n=1 Tax=Pseudomonas reinekei TaxID=395598 RepID=A0A1H0T5I7_PSERE|nr:non-ribosomal peptide synthetase [Pseudomonas reinekei]KAB0483607.1 amino acid adenylation domain-containing protein [Pseudomonas reinekei]OLU00637.1 non-ribosomal peptide synthetase [Pseudomonas reinekei]SDP49071.1 non-ribosomal peptide synthase domain TIGR01720/amino acid adenylation domain-containing protein [Pseudomonas reinekei]